jgi:hypothetical protein
MVLFISPALTIRFLGLNSRRFLVPTITANIGRARFQCQGYGTYSPVITSLLQQGTLIGELGRMYAETASPGLAVTFRTETATVGPEMNGNFSDAIAFLYRIRGVDDAYHNLLTYIATRPDSSLAVALKNVLRLGDGKTTLTMDEITDGPLARLCSSRNCSRAIITDGFRCAFIDYRSSNLWGDLVLKNGSIVNRLGPGNLEMTTLVINANDPSYIAKHKEFLCSAIDEVLVEKDNTSRKEFLANWSRVIDHDN